MTGLQGIKACVFDAYGTLFDINAPVAGFRDEIGDKADRLTEIWRAKQLSYSWLRSLMRDYVDFWAVTGDALLPVSPAMPEPLRSGAGVWRHSVTNQP
ncbi:MAG: HAD-IA family hydrolase [Rhodospirillales bacterium]|nr:HAD-IA family hydrolase [Rhodospirillales bacterium]